MPRRKALTEAEKKTIIKLRKKRLSYRKIAKKIKRSPAVVGKFCKSPSNYGLKKRTGRKKKVSPRDKRLIMRLSSNSAISGAKIASQLSNNVSKWTIVIVFVDSASILSTKNFRSLRLLKSSTNEID